MFGFSGPAWAWRNFRLRILGDLGRSCQPGPRVLSPNHFLQVGHQSKSRAVITHTTAANQLGVSGRESSLCVTSGCFFQLHSISLDMDAGLWDPGNPTPAFIR